MRTALCIAVLIECATVLRADTITLSTPGNVYNFSHTGTSHSVGNEDPLFPCNQPISPFTNCSLTVSGNSLFPVSPGSTTYYLTAPNGTLSEKVELDFNVLPNSYDIVYTSGLEGSGQTIPPGSNTLVYNGVTELVTTVTWNDSSFDQIFVTGPEPGAPVPEPSTASLVIIACLGLMFLSKKRIKLNRS